MSENVTSINQNGQNEGGIAQVLNQKDGQIEYLRNRVRTLEEAGEREPVKLEDVLNRLQPPENYEPTYELRSLTRADAKQVRQMIRKFIKNENLQELFGGNPNAEDMLGIVDFFFDELEDDILPWAISLTGKSEEEWENEPASADTDVLNDLKAHKDFLAALKSGASLILTSRSLFGR